MNDLKNPCCEKMAKAIKADDIFGGLVWGDHGNLGYFINGDSRLSPSGDGYTDMESVLIRIEFCPFCGKKLPEPPFAEEPQ